MMTPANDRWLAKNVQAEEEDELLPQKGQERAPSPTWSRRDDKDVDEMLGLGDHAPPSHQMSNSNMMKIIGQDDYFIDDDPEDVSTLANDTVSNGTFFQDDATSTPPRPISNRNGDQNSNNGKDDRLEYSPTSTLPETPPPPPPLPRTSSEKLFQDDSKVEELGGYSKRFIRLTIIAAVLAAFLVVVIAVLSVNYRRIEREQGREASPNLRNPTSPEEDSFDFDLRTSVPTITITMPPTLSSAPTTTFAPTTQVPSALPTTSLPTLNPTTSMEPTIFAPSTPDPTNTPTTAAPTTPLPTMDPTTQSPTRNGPDELVDKLQNTPNFPTATREDLRDESSDAYQVVEWMAKDPNLDSYDDATLVHRFALSTFYIGLSKNRRKRRQLQPPGGPPKPPGGPSDPHAPPSDPHSQSSSQFSSSWMTYTDFCDWELSGGESLCNSNGQPVSIVLENADLTGTLAPELSLLANSLEKLYLSNNMLEGSIPTEYGLLTEMGRFRLHGNRLDGTIPTELGNMRKLLSLRLGRNKLEGTIPTEVGRMKDLETLHLPGNELKGKLPNSITDLDHLTTIVLKENLLTGTISKDFAKMKDLENLELQYNEFRGDIKEKDFCKDLDIFIVDCQEVKCKCCKRENCAEP